MVNVGKQPVAWKECCAENWLKELQESIDRCTGHRDITEILLKMALNTIQSINPFFGLKWQPLMKNLARNNFLSALSFTILTFKDPEVNAF